MRSLLWLLLFFIASNALGTAIWLLGSWMIGGFHVQGADEFYLPGLVFLVFGMDSFFGGPVLIVAAAALVRQSVGRLTGFTAGVTAVVAIILLGCVAGKGGIEIGAMVGAVKLVGAVLLARVPFFRRKALELSPPSRFRGLSNSYAIALEPGESPAVALGRRASGERRWSLRGARRPACWDPSFSRMGPTPRPTAGGVRKAFLTNKGAVIAWASLAVGGLAAVGCGQVLRLPDDPLADKARRSLAQVALAVLALALVRYGALRLYERVRLLRLLRDGEIVSARRSSDTLFDQRGATITVGETRAGPIVILGPTPLASGDVQGLLVGENGDVVAWDLLPAKLAVDDAGAITVT